MSKIILLIEDYDDSRKMLKFYLENSTYRVIEATNGFDAIEFVNQELPNLILSESGQSIKRKAIDEDWIGQDWAKNVHLRQADSKPFVSFVSAR